VDLIQVDPASVQPSQRVLDAADDPPPERAALLGVISHRKPDLHGQEHVVALAVSQSLADDDLRLPGGVDVGGVDEVDPRVQRMVDDADALGRAARV
jgi:hypothetical protein